MAPSLKLSLVAFASMFVAGCALDMRCQCVSDRIKMHEGTPWRMDYETGEEKEARIMKMMGGSPAEAGDEAAEVRRVKSYCANVAKKCRFAPKAVESAESDEQSTKKDDAEGGDMVETMQADVLAAMAAGGIDDRDCPGPGGDVPRPSNVKEARTHYLYGKEIFLSENRMQLGEDGEIKLFLVNEGLNCRLEGSSTRGWRCRRLRNDIPPLPDNEALKLCKSKVGRTPKLAINLFGVIDDRFCVKVSVLETKKVQDEVNDLPTNINRDVIKVSLACARIGGPGAPGVVVGGPRPNFRSPVGIATEK